MRRYVFDIETYQNYILFSFKCPDDGSMVAFEIKGAEDTLTPKQISKLKKLLSKNVIITYNGLKFDEPITSYALSGATATKLYKAVQALIVQQLPSWQFYRQAKVERCIPNHIDLMDVARGSASLKLYGARLGAKKLQDLPYEPSTVLTKAQMQDVYDYCENDLDLTDLLFTYLKNDLDLREAMGKQYNMDFMSFKGAKIAEMILVHECGYTGKAPSIPKYIEYTAPKYIKFKTPKLQALFTKIKEHKFLIMNSKILTQIDELKLEDDYTFLLDDLGITKSTKSRHGSKSKKTISDSGNVIQPDFLDAPIVIDGIEHNLGLGGVHGSVSKTTFIPEDDEIIVDIDYKSLYPSLIIENNFVPKHIGKKYLSVYQGMYDARNKELKPAMKKVEYKSAEYNELDRKQNTMKLVLNSSFGQTGQRYSKIYDPSAMLHTTITGQLTLMMVIEKLHLKGFQTFYANTDGITLLIKKKDLKKVQKITTKFDAKTGLEMEYNYFTASHIRDVNNFINITDDGKVKSKGAFAELDIEKNPQAPIVFEAIRQYLLNGTSIKKTIKACKETNMFCSSRVVTGGAMYAENIPDMYPERWDESFARNKRRTLSMLKEKEKLEAVWVKENGTYLGKVVRFYYSTNGNTIHYKKSGNKVPMSDGSRPMMDLERKLPKDLDYKWYYNYAKQMLLDLGLT